MALSLPIVSAGRRRPRVVLAGTALLALLVYGALIGKMLAPDDYNPLTLAHLSVAFPGQRFWDQSPPLEVRNKGYDGQFNYYIARDPLLLSGPPTYLDNPAYRYQRILLPALAYLLAAGQAPLIGWTLLLVNVLAMAAGCWAVLEVLGDLGANRWWVLPYLFNPAFLIGIPFDLSEPLALGLVGVACLAYMRRHHWLAIGLIAAAGLAREPALSVAAAFAAFEVVQNRRWRLAARYLLAPVVVVAWDLSIWMRLGHFPAQSAAARLQLPLSGAYQATLLFLGIKPDSAVSLLPTTRLEALAMMGLILLLALSAIALARVRKPFHWQVALQGLLVLGWDFAIWRDALGFTRIAMLLIFFWTLAAAERSADRRPAVAPAPGRMVLAAAGSRRETAVRPGEP